MSTDSKVGYPDDLGCSAVPICLWWRMRQGLSQPMAESQMVHLAVRMGAIILYFAYALNSRACRNPRSNN